MLTVLVTGAKGFVGRNLCAVLRRRDDVQLHEYDLGNNEQDLNAYLGRADVVFHLAGVNRPQNPEEFREGNAAFTEQICGKLTELARTPRIVLTSSIQAERDNPYGASKREAETVLERFAVESGAECLIFRLKNLFGKWCRPNYNSVTATFCHNIAHGLPIQISDPANVVDLTYIDDVVDAFCSFLSAPQTPGLRFADPLRSHQISLGDLSRLIMSFKEHRKTLTLPDYSDHFVRALYATFLSYVDDDDYDYALDIKADSRGSLAELIKSPRFGQIFVSRTRPGITRGNHFHHTKTEKFMVVEGDAVIRLRHIDSDDVTAFAVRGDEFRVVDIPPGYTHSIENVGEGTLVTLFWASEVFDPDHTDTWYEPVLP